MFEELYSAPTPVQHQLVRGGSWRPTGREDVVGVTPVKPGRVDPEYSWNWYHPDRAGVKLAPEAFRQRLKEIDPRLEVTWHPIHQRWVCFFRDTTVRFWMCPNWKRLFIVRYHDGSYMPLDERTLAEAWSRNPKLYGYNGRQFFDRVVLERMRDDMKRDVRQHESEVEAVARDRWRYAQIKNIGTGSKFCNHEAAD